MSAVDHDVADEDEDEEGYWGRLQDAAPGDEEDTGEVFPVDKETHHQDRAEGELTEAAYFGAVLNEAGRQSSCILGEESLVWQSLLRSAASSSTSLSSSSSSASSKSSSALQLASTSVQVEMLSQFLFSHLPLSSAAFCQIRRVRLAPNLGDRKETEEEMETTTAYSDDILHPSLVMLVSKRPKPVGDLSIILFSSLPLSKALSNQVGNVIQSLKEKLEMPQHQSVTFAAIDVWLIHEPLLEGLSARGMKQSWDERSIMWVLNDTGAASTDKYPVPSDYYLSPLTQADANLINETWKYKSEFSIGMVREMIKNLPAVGLRMKEGDSLVCWCLSYANGMLGMLYTLKEHRGKSLAKVILAALIEKWLGAGFNCSPFLYSAISNAASANVFRHLGFTKVQDCTWVGVEWI